MTAAKVMIKNVVTLRSNATVKEAAHLLSSRHISGAPVLDDSTHKLVGVISLSDLATHASHSHERIGEAASSRKSYYVDANVEEDEIRQGFSVEDYSDSTAVRDVMNPTVISVQEETPLTEVIKILLSAEIHRVIVTRAEKLVGIISMTDLVRAFGETLSARRPAA